MKRVSSRQRLVSWDAFDATAQEEEEEHDSLSDFESSPTLDQEQQQGIVSKNVASNFLLPSSPNSTDSLSSYTTAATDLSSTMTTTVAPVVSPYASLKRKRSSAAKLAQEPSSIATAVSPDDTKDANVPKPEVVEAYGWELSYDNDNDNNKNDEQELASTQLLRQEEQPQEDKQCLSFLDLSDDVTLRILSFVGPKDVCKAVMPTCHKLHALLQTTEADLLWKEYCQLQWPESSSSQAAASAQDTQYVCYLNLVNHQHHQQQQKQASGGGAGEYRLQTIPYATLTALSPSRYATAIDETLFAPCRWSRTLGRYRPRRSTSTTELRTVAVSRGNDEPARVAIQFTGEIGTGDRCIRSNHAWSTPLPWNPQQQQQQPDNHKEQGVSRHCGGPLTRLFHRHHHNNNNNNNNSHHNSHQNHHHPFQQQPPPNQSLYLPHHYSLSASLPIRRHPPRLLERLRRGRSSEAQQQQSLSSPLQDSPLQWRPFVIPYAERLPDGTLVQNITPRLIQYYEVSILPKPNDAEATAATRPRVPARHDDNDDNDQDLMFRRHGNNTSECVAVGLSCVEFALHTRMPGWDHLSYGYHGDDGGVFYGTGHMLREYGPTFGVGDVVGCGVDYLRGNIFFTLNGRYLGVAWDGLAHSPHNDFYAREWYPTVGMDTHCLVQCNFGQDPFQFDLSKHVQQTQGTILEQSLVNPAVAAATAPAATTQSAHF